MEVRERRQKKDSPQGGVVIAWDRAFAVNVLTKKHARQKKE